MIVIYGRQAQEYIVNNMEAILSGEVYVLEEKEERKDIF